MKHDLIREAANHLNIEGVNLAANSVVLDPEFNPRMEYGETAFNLEWGTYRTALARLERADKSQAELMFHVWFVGTARIFRGLIPEGTEGVPKDLPVLAEMKSEFTLQYLVQGGWEPNLEALHEFAVHNAPIHVWPYWREWLHNISNRIGLPPLILSMHMLPPSKDVPFPQAAATSAGGADSKKELTGR